MKRKLFLTLLLCAMCVIPMAAAHNNTSTASTEQLRVLQYNTWNEGALVKGGQQSIKDIIDQMEIDVVLFQEIRGQKFIDEIIAYLKEKGKTYYGYSLNISTAILSRYPIEKVRGSFELGKDSYAFVKANVTINHNEFAFYSIHMDWKYLTYHNMLGYSDHSPFEKISEPWTDVDKILAWNNKSRRGKEIKAIIADAQKEIKQGHLVILGGDFNEASMLDWREDTKNINHHNGLVIDWPCSAKLLKAGFCDTYRTKYPNPVTHPGYTCKAGNKDMKPKEHKRSLRQRIDLNYFYPHQNLTLTDAFIVGPQEELNNGNIQPKESKDIIITPGCIWASDHKAVLSIYEVRSGE